jgi:hypothetical protein
MHHWRPCLPHKCWIALLRHPCGCASIGMPQQDMRTEKSASKGAHFATPWPPRVSHRCFKFVAISANQQLGATQMVFINFSTPRQRIPFVAQLRITELESQNARFRVLAHYSTDHHQLYSSNSIWIADKFPCKGFLSRLPAGRDNQANPSTHSLLQCSLCRCLVAQPVAFLLEFCSAFLAARLGRDRRAGCRV